MAIDVFTRGVAVRQLPKLSRKRYVRVVSSVLGFNSTGRSGSAVPTAAELPFASVAPLRPAAVRSAISLPNPSTAAMSVGSPIFRVMDKLSRSNSKFVGSAVCFHSALVAFSPSVFRSWLHSPAPRGGCTTLMPRSVCFWAVKEVLAWPGAWPCRPARIRCSVASASCRYLSAAPVRILGVDDWAFRKGHTYGTILCDLERRRPVDLLPERSAESLRQWLLPHPEVEIITRDRGDDYIKGATIGAPQAVQVADRWHLLRNLSDAVRRLVDRLAGRIRRAVEVLPADSPSLQPVAVPDEVSEKPCVAEQSEPTRYRQRQLERRQRRLERYQHVQELHQQGVAHREIGRRLGMNRATVRRLVRAESFPERAARLTPRRTDELTDYLHDRWNDGYRNAARLFEELNAKVYLISAPQPWHDLCCESGAAEGCSISYDGKMDEPACPGCRALHKQVAELQAQVAEQGQRLEEALRAGKRQAAPFRKGPPKPKPQRPGRKAGDRARPARPPPAAARRSKSTNAMTSPCPTPARIAAAASSKRPWHSSSRPRSPVSRSCGNSASTSATVPAAAAACRGGTRCKRPTPWAAPPARSGRTRRPPRRYYTRRWACRTAKWRPSLTACSAST